MPGNYLYVWLIALLFPRAKIIHCLRDPRDVGFSIFTFRFYGHHGYAHDVADLGWMIGEQHRLMTHWKSALPLPILDLRLDQWVHEFDATLARTLDFLGLPPDPACAPRPPWPADRCFFAPASGWTSWSVAPGRIMATAPMAAAAAAVS